MNNPFDILNSHKLSKTNSRVDILEVFINSQKKGLAETEIEEITDGEYDKATIFRNLKTFLDKGIIHKIMDDEGKSRYALCSECKPDKHNHEHIHFKCNSCNNTTCLDDNNAEINIKIPKGYTKTFTNYLIVGTCADCNKLI